MRNGFLRFAVYLIITGIFFLLNSCSECDEENPTVVLINNGTGKADIQIKTSGGNTENINNIEIGTSSEKRSFDPGDIEFTVAIQGVNDPIVYLLKISFCSDYVVTINSDNSVTETSSKRD